MDASKDDGDHDSSSDQGLFRPTTSRPHEHQLAPVQRRGLTSRNGTLKLSVSALPACVSVPPTKAI
jgi:hypothetical protein